MSKASKRPAIVPPTPEEDAEITAAAKTDPDAQPLTDPQLAAMVVMREKINTVCDEVDTRPDPFVAAAARRILEHTEW